MQQLIKFGFISGLILSGSAYALEPVQGFYLGILGEISHASNSQIDFVINQIPYNAQVSLGPVGGGGALSIGYKVNSFRLETELLVNVNTFTQAKVGSCTLVSPNVVSPQGVCPAFVTNNGLGFKGNTTGAYGLFNVIFDFLPGPESDRLLVPYIGLGLGGAMIRTKAQVQTNKFATTLDPSLTTPVSVSKNMSKSGFAGQGIIGLSYYMDDYATIGMDFRYVSTQTSKNSNATTSTSSNKQYGIATLNFVGTFAFDNSTN